MSGGYGVFDDAAREYVIRRPDTPLPWLNYLGQDDLFGLCTNTGGGYTFWRDARLRRLTRYRYNDVPLDSVGRYLYVRDGDRVWSPGWKPARVPLDRYECGHGLGYTRILGAKDRAEVELCFFVDGHKVGGNLVGLQSGPEPVRVEVVLGRSQTGAARRGHRDPGEIVVGASVGSTPAN